MGKVSLGQCVRLNFQRSVHQGKNLVVFICMALFFASYFQNVGGRLAASELTVGIHEIFPVVMNTNYTVAVVWIGYILIICDLPYDETGFELYLVRTSKRGWFIGQIAYMLSITVIYFLYLQLLFGVLLFPQISFSETWSKGFISLINNPAAFGIEYRFAYSLSIIRGQTAFVVYGKQMLLCVLAGSAISSIVMLFNMFWKNGMGAALGGSLIALDYLITYVILGVYELYYFSPITLTRISCISSSAANAVLPSFQYACGLLSGVTVVLAVCMMAGMKFYEFKEGGGR